MNDDWVRMLANELSAEESSALLTATLDELNEVLEHTPAVRDTTIRILEARLAAPLTENSWNSLIESLGAFLGRSSAYLLSWISYGDWKERMDQVSAHASPEAVRFLGELLGIFGYDIRRAMVLYAELPDDWQDINLYVVQNYTGSGYRISVKLAKVTGDKVTLEGPPDSFLTLARHLVESLVIVGDASAFDPERVKAFNEQVKELEKLLTEGQASETAKGAEAATSTVAVPSPMVDAVSSGQSGGA